MKWLTAASWLVALIWLHDVPRTSFPLVWTLYSLAFGLYLMILLGRRPISLREGLWLALVARLAGMAFSPQLSDDYFRFVWDGMLTWHGVHPMAFTPEEMLSNPGAFPIDTALYHRLNHTAYHSVYPPVAQAVFLASYAINGADLGGHVLFMKVVLCLVDAGIVWLLIGILRSLGEDPRRALWFALSPLVIIELTGNLHMEGLMILGLLAAVRLALHDHTRASIAAMALSVLSKLISLILAPFLPGAWSGRRFMMPLFALGLFVAASFLLSFGTEIEWLQSVRLWFQTFEFNAGVYYFIRWIGYQLTGYNAIHHIGPALAIATAVGLAVIWWVYRFRRTITWQAAMTLALTLYFLLGTTIHPWYITTVLTVGLLAGWAYPVAWTYLAAISYSHYDGGGFAEHYGLLAVEYITLSAVMVTEYWIRRKTKRPLP